MTNQSDIVFALSLKNNNLEAEVERLQAKIKHLEWMLAKANKSRTADLDLLNAQLDSIDYLLFPQQEVADENKRDSPDLGNTQ